MKQFFFIFLCFLFFFNTNAQDIKCSDLLSGVKSNGFRKGFLSSLDLYQSSWLQSVEAYSYENVIFVVAEIKQDDYGLNTKKYIFCGIPSQNWDAFYYGFGDVGKSYGERFNKYIMDYTCDCY